MYRTGVLFTLLHVTATLLWLACTMGCESRSSQSESAAHPKATVRIFAAASLTDAMNELAAACLKEERITLEISADASSTLAKQIEQGAKCDLFISANPQWMDYVGQRSLIEASSRCDLLGNTLVIIAPRGEAFAVRFDPNFKLFAALGEDGRLSVADPAHVPAGQYAKEALQSLGWWEAVEPRIIPALDVRAALRLVESGEAAAGIVYGSDVGAAEVEQLGIIPQQHYAPIVYPAAIIAGADLRAADVLKFLRSPEAAAIFQKHGFIVLEQPEDSTGTMRTLLDAIQAFAAC